MNDCPNADVRDMLPDLVNERLDAGARAMVEGHVLTCADCAVELTLLRNLRAARRTPRVDTAAIAAALPSYPAAPRRSWVGWRAAAAIAVLLGGASTIAVLRHSAPSAVVSNVASSAGALPATSGVVPTPPAPSVVTPRHVAASAPVVEPVQKPALPARADVRAVRELAMGGGALGDLDDRELSTLLKDIESLDAVPSVEVDNTPVSPIAPGSSSQASPR